MRNADHWAGDYRLISTTRSHVSLNAARNELGRGGNWSGGIDWEIGNVVVRDGIGGIEGSVLIGAIAEGVLQIVVHAEAGAEDGRCAERAPGNTDARLGKKYRVVVGESRGSDVRLAGDHAIAEGVSCGASVVLVPAVGGFIAHSDRYG